MKLKDSILLVLYNKVRYLEKPEDFPTEATKISLEIGMELEEVIYHCYQLSNDALLKISNLGVHPLLYLTNSGISRAKRIKARIQP